MSTQPAVSQTLKKTDPTLKDLLDVLKKDILLNFNCHAIAKVESFNPDMQTVQATILYPWSKLQKQSSGAYETVWPQYPLIVDAPVIIFRGGDWALTFPISVGDECLILFNDRDMDNWFAGGQSAPVASGRLHAFTDALALIGPRSSGNVLSSYDTTRAVLANGETMVGVGETLIKIANATTTLNTLLQSLITAINGIKVDPGTFQVSGTPVTGQGEVATASQSALSSIASDISGLLE